MVLTTISGVSAFWETLQTTGLPFLGAGLWSPVSELPPWTSPGGEGGTEVEAIPPRPAPTFLGLFARWEVLLPASDLAPGAGALS